MRTKIRNAILCGSSKGGTAKSTSATLIALELHNRGYSVALCDLDISGPSLPKICNVTKPLSGGPIEGITCPITKDGIPLLSIELFLNDKSTAILWRGDRITSYIRNTLENVNFGKSIDYLIMDLPPGFSNPVQAPIEFVKENKIKSGIVFVSQPNSISVNDVSKGITASRKLNLPIVGIIESMNKFTCPICKTEHKLFGDGAVEEISKKENIKYLGNIPFVPEMSTITELSLTTIPSSVKTFLEPIVSNILKFYGEQ